MTYIQVRNEAAAAAAAGDDTFVRHVENIPYFPLLKVDPSKEQTVIKVAQMGEGLSNLASGKVRDEVRKEVNEILSKAIKK